MKQKNMILAVSVTVALVAGFLAVAHLVGIWSIAELWSQFFAACMGAIVVAVVTLVLMRGQRTSEEEKEKSIRLHENKVEAYSRFVGKMYKLLADDRMSCEDFLNLRTDIFGSLIFYLSDDNLEHLLHELNGVTDINDDDEMVKVFARITNILQDDLDNLPYQPDKKERILVNLWRQFGHLSTCSVKPKE